MLLSLQAGLEMCCHLCPGHLGLLGLGLLGRGQWKMEMQVRWGLLGLWGWWALSALQSWASSFPWLASRLQVLLGLRLRARLEPPGWPGWRLLLGEEAPARLEARVEEALEARLLHCWSCCWSCSRHQASGRWSQWGTRLRSACIIEIRHVVNSRQWPLRGQYHP